MTTFSTKIDDSSNDDYTYNYDQIKHNAGVYEPKGFKGTYLVSFPKNRLTDNYSVIYLCKFHIEIADNHWHDKKFKKLEKNVEVCIY